MSSHRSKSNAVHCLVDAKNVVGEGPLWHVEEGSVYWTDICGFRIYRYRPVDGDVIFWQFNEPVCALSSTTDPARILVALGSQVILWAPTTDERVAFARPEPNTPYNRLNDGATDPGGAFWVGSMRNNVAPDGSPLDVSGNTGSLYRVTADGEVTVWDRGYGITNTLVWSPDRKTFYCGCSTANVIYAYDYDASESSVKNRRVFAEGAPRGVPDGSAIDSEGFLWNARYDGGCILRFSPAGKIDRVIEMPVSNVTNCEFGGPDLRTLYITTAAKDGERYSGGLFVMATDVEGLSTGRFRIMDDARPKSA